MGNPTTDKTAKAYVHKEKRGTNKTKARVGNLPYKSCVNVNPQSTEASTYLVGSHPNTKKSKAVAGSFPMGIVKKSRNAHPATAGITAYATK